MKRRIPLRSIRFHLQDASQMAQATAFKQSPVIHSCPVKPKRWKRRLIVLSLSLLAFAFFAPVIVANTGLRNWVAAEATAQVHGTVRIGGASLWWFSSPYLENVEIRNEAGDLVVQIARVELNKPLLALLFDNSDLGEIRLQRPTVFVTASDDTTNLEQVFSWYFDQPQKGDQAGTKQARRAVKVSCHDAKVFIVESGKEGTWEIDPLHVDLRVDADHSKPIEITIRSNVTINNSTGKFDLEGRLSQKLELNAENIPLRLVGLIARRFEPGIYLAGRGSARVEFVWGADGRAGNSIQIEGQVGASNLILVAPNWIADRVAISQLNVPAKLTIEESLIRIDRLEMASDFGRASIRGEINSSVPPLDLLRQPNAQLTLDLDLARLAAIFPKTLHLQDDVRVTAGRLRANLASVQEKDDFAWRGVAKTTNLGALRNGQAITWDQPLDIDFLARLGRRGLPTVERLHFTSDFGKADATTSTDSIDVTAEIDLTRFRERLAQFIDLGSIHLEGMATAKLTGSRRDPTNGITALKLDATIRNGLVGSPAAPYWQEKEFGIVARANYSESVDSLQMEQVTLRGDGFACSGKGTLSNVSVEPIAAISGELEYDWARLGPKLRTHLGSQFDLSGKGSRVFHINGPLSATKKSSMVVATLVSSSGARSEKPTGLVVDFGLGWDSLNAFGAKIGAAKVDARLEPGWLRTAPIITTLSDGQLHVEPSVRFDNGVAALLISKGSGVQRARITPAICSDVIGYAAPALAGVAEAEGEFSLVFDQCQAPLTDLSKTALSGKMYVHSMKISGSPLLKELTLILQGTSIATRPTPTLSVSIAHESMVNIHVANGRVYHDKMELVFPEFTMRTSGSVGFDGTLALIAEMTVPPRWVPGGLLKPAIAKQVIQIPIRGTLSHPKMDEAALRTHVAKVAENVGKEAAQDLLKKELDKGLDKLLPKFQKK